tara:strand:- start:377 stop:1069 length:693 start_codon:yes stop_codon:yes gene_type:complete
MGTENYVIEFFSNEWIINTLVSLVVILTLLLIGRISSYNQRLNLAKGIAVLLIISTITEHSRNIINGYWNMSENLPLHLCGISNLIACFILFTKRNKVLFEFLFYAGIIGGIQAFLTPQINNFDGSFFEYFSYHFSHGGIIFLPTFMYLYLNYELTKFSWLRVVLYLNIVLAFVMPLNFQIDSNYMYLAYPPNVNNPLILGEWPYYILYWEFIIVIFTYTTYVISTRKSL